MGEIFIKPDGTTTKSGKKFAESIREFAAPVMNVTKMFMRAYDPFVSFINAKGEIVDLPIWFVKMLNEHLPKISWKEARKGYDKDIEDLQNEQKVFERELAKWKREAEIQWIE